MQSATASAKWAAAAAIAVVCSLSGCGGGGSPAGPSSTTETEFQEPGTHRAPLPGGGEITLRFVAFHPARGARVFSLAEECRDVDAFSLWRDRKPFVFLNTQKSAERSRFDAAHELGHLALHRHGGPASRGREAEREADEFASAFLMPRASVLAVAPRYPTLSMIVSLKKQWNVSAAALVHRLRGVGLLTEWHYRTLMVDLSQHGYRTNEPEPGERETSQVLQKVFTALRARGVTRAALARDLGVGPADIDALVFGLAFVALRPSQQPERTATSPANVYRLTKRK